MVRPSIFTALCVVVAIASHITTAAPMFKRTSKSTILKPPSIPDFLAKATIAPGASASSSQQQSTRREKIDDICKGLSFFDKQRTLSANSDVDANVLVKYTGGKYYAVTADGPIKPGMIVLKSSSKKSLWILDPSEDAIRKNRQSAKAKYRSPIISSDRLAIFNPSSGKWLAISTFASPTKLKAVAKEGAQLLPSNGNEWNIQGFNEEDLLELRSSQALSAALGVGYVSSDGMAILAKNDLSGIYSWKATKPFTSHSGVHQDQEVVYAFSHFTKKNEWLTLEQEQFLKTYSLNPVHVGTLVDVDAVAAAAASSPQDQQQQQQHQQQPFTNSQPPDSASNNSPLAAAFPEVPQVSSMKDFYQDSWYQQNYHPSHNYHAGAEQEQHAFYHQQQQQEQQHSSVNSDPNTAAGAIRAGAIVAITEGGVVHERQTSGLRRLNTDNIVRPLTINSQHFSLVSVPTASSSSTSLRRELDLGPVPVVVSSGESSEIPFALPISQSQPPKIKAPTAHTQELAAPHVASYHPNDRKLFAPTVGTSSGTSSMQNQLLRQNEAEAPVASSSSSSPPSATGELESSLAQLQVSIGKSSRRPRVSLPPSTAFPPPASAYASGEISSQHTRPESSRGILSAPVRTISKEASASVPAAATIYQPVASSSSSLSSFHRRRPSWTPGDDAHLIANMNSVPPTSNEDHESDFGSIVDSDDEHEVEPVV